MTCMPSLRKSRSSRICIAVFCATITARIFLPTSQRRWRMPSLACFPPPAPDRLPSRSLLPEYGEPIQLSSAFFLRLLEARTIVIPKGETEEQVQLDAQERMAAASKADFRIANERFRWVSAYLEGEI